MKVKNKKSKFNLNNIDVGFFEAEDEVEELGVDDKLKEIVEKYLELDYPISISKGEDELGPYWVAEHPDLPGCKTHGETTEEAIKNLEEAKASWMYSFADMGKEIPKPNQVKGLDDFSGKILLRIPKELHYKLTFKAKSNGVSLNQEILFLLSSSLEESNTVDQMELINKKLDRLQYDLKQKTQVDNKFYEDRMENLNNILFRNGKTHRATEVSLEEAYSEMYEKNDKGKSKSYGFYESFESSVIQ